MKIWDLALKDLLRSVRSISFIGFGFVVPLLVTGLFYFAFGGLSGGDGGFDLPVTGVVIVNQDEGQRGFSAGQTLLEVLRAPALAGLLQVTVGSDPAAARAAVDRQEAGVAIVIPAGMTTAVVDPGGQAQVELYKDPTLTLGPSIVKSLLSQFVDSFSGAKIAAAVASEQLAARGVTVDYSLAQTVSLQYAAWAQALGQSQQGSDNALVQFRSPAKSAREPVDLRTSVLSMIMAGMMVFYLFFTGAASAQSILEEEEAGTLPRLFTTPTDQSSILGGKLLAALVTLAVQVVVLLILSALIYGIHWGRPLPLSLVSLSLIVLSACFGLFVTSLLKNSRQGGIVYGGVMTVMGMVGMIGTFAATAPGATKGAFDTVSLLVPQGWGVRGLQQLLDGGGIVDVLPTVAVMLVLSVLFFLLGLLRFRKRFA